MRVWCEIFLKKNKPAFAGFFCARVESGAVEGVGRRVCGLVIFVEVGLDALGEFVGILQFVVGFGLGRGEERCSARR